MTNNQLGIKSNPQCRYDTEMKTLNMLPTWELPLKFLNVQISNYALCDLNMKLLEKSKNMSNLGGKTNLKKLALQHQAAEITH